MMETMLPNAAPLLHKLAKKGYGLGSAESCTGGLISAAITAIPGCSAQFHLGKVTYANSAKVNELGVPEELLQQQGAVSHDVAKVMAHSIAQQTATLTKTPCMGLASTGIAGPEGSANKPVGLVYLAVALSHQDAAHVQEYLFTGSRREIQYQAVAHIIKMALSVLEAEK